MQADGNAVAYNGKFSSTWSSGTYPYTGNYLRLLTDGNLVTTVQSFQQDLFSVNEIWVNQHNSIFHNSK
jgi:hypothetical protein